MGGLKEGIENSGIEVTTTNIDFINHLKENVYQFSFAKNHNELKTLTASILKPDGTVRSFTEFRTEAVKITGINSGNWLQAEYNLAVSGGQMAAKWKEFERTGDFTMLRYSTVKDKRVSDICKPLEGVTKLITDPFWNTRYPPNHINCRCDVDRVPYSSPVTPDSKIEPVEIPPMLRTNLGKQGLVFPPEHPYYIGCKQESKNYATEAMKGNEAVNAKARAKQLRQLTAFEETYNVKITDEFKALIPEDVKVSFRADGACFLPMENRVVLDKSVVNEMSKYRANSVVYHEFGHAIDYAYKFKKLEPLSELMDKYRNHLSTKDENGRTLFESVTKRLKEIKKEAGKDFDKLVQTSSTADTIMSLDYRYGWGHSREYFSYDSLQKAEFIAHCFENRFMGNNVFKEVLPELYEEMITLCDTMLSTIPKQPF